MSAADKTRNGRPPRDEVSEERIAQRLGISRHKIRDAQDHAAAAESYPFLQGADWSQRASLEASKKLDALPVKDRAVVTDILSEPGIPVASAMRIISNVSDMEPEQRAEIRRLHASDDDRDRTLAKTKAHKSPPMPDAIELEAFAQRRRWRWK